LETLAKDMKMEFIMVTHVEEYKMGTVKEMK